METLNPTSDQLYSHFSKRVLAIFTADFLLNNELSKLSADQVKEIEREKRFAQMDAMLFYTQLQAKGIPVEMLSCHLTPFD